MTLSILYEARQGEAGIRAAMDRICRQLDESFEKGFNLFILSDRGVDAEHAAIPSLLAVSGVQAHTLRRGIRTQMSLVLESGEPTAVHHFAALIGYGATAIHPYLALRTVREAVREGHLAGVTEEEAQARYLHAAVKGVVKTMSKMGISTVQSYRGSQLFEAVGLSRALIDEFFPETVSRIGGMGLDGVARENAARHDAAFHDPQGEAALAPAASSSGAGRRSITSTTPKPSICCSRPFGPMTTACSASIPHGWMAANARPPCAA